MPEQPAASFGHRLIIGIEIAIGAALVSVVVVGFVVSSDGNWENWRVLIFVISFLCFFFYALVRASKSLLRAIDRMRGGEPAAAEPTAPVTTERPNNQLGPGVSRNSLTEA